MELTLARVPAAVSLADPSKAADQQFFIAFFTTYVLLALALNVAWKAGWHGITPPHDAAEEPETVN